MATISAHGGGCCGMRHIQGFRDGDGENVRQLARRTQPYADSRHQLEVILSDLQTRENPALLAALARLGYVYTSSWSGQHSTPVHLFLRAKYRLALESAHFYNRWVNDLNGMLPHPGLGGPLPRWTEPVRAAQQRWEVGTRVRCINPRSPNHGLPGTITRMADMGYAWSYGQVTFDHSERSNTYP